MSTNPPFNYGLGLPLTRPALYFPPLAPVHMPFVPSILPQPLRPPTHPSVEDFMQLVAARYPRPYVPIIPSAYAIPSNCIHPSPAAQILSSIGYVNLLNLLEQTSRTLTTPTYLNPSCHVQPPPPPPLSSTLTPTSESNPLGADATPILEPLRVSIPSSPKPDHPPTPEQPPLPVERPELDLKQLHPESYMDQLAVAIGSNKFELFRKSLANDDLDDNEFMDKCLYYHRKKRSADRQSSTIFMVGKTSYQIMRKNKPMTAKQWSEFKLKADGLTSLRSDGKYYYCKCIECIATKAEFVSLQTHNIFNHIMKREGIYFYCPRCGFTFKTEKSAIKHKCRKKQSAN